MDAIPSTSIQNPQHENTNDQSLQRESQRLPETSKQPLKITDLDDNCLEKIFGYLDLSDLFNVAVSNEYLRPAAGIVYKRKFGTLKVCIKNFLSPVSKPYVVHTWINVVGLKMSLQFLRCLCPSISNLLILYDDFNKKRCDHIHQYLNKYCADSLVNIEFGNKRISKPIKHFEKPFVNVRSVKVRNSQLGNQLSSFSQWFPNLRSLDLNAAQIGRCSIGTPFLHLEDLSIQIVNGGLGFAIKKTAHLLGSCPQLQKLDINVLTGEEITLNKLSNIIKNYRSICNLKLSVECGTLPVAVSAIQQLVNELPLLAELELPEFKFDAEAALSVIRQITSLKLFRFKVAKRSEYESFVSQLDSQCWRLSSVEDFSGNFHVTLRR